ncbi:MAG: hypothetical protein CVV56_00635 [Tenericutes bacterium HGW-Tenericutes-1]|nr:MAG: hypothetical protein CVV56_00635 [Tenericutes bacterium HGW-Tenericutes-1]
MKRKLLMLVTMILFMFLNGCMWWDIDFDFTTNTQTALTTTLPTISNGTMTIETNQYASYASFASETYNLTDIDEYNDILLATRNKIRKSNVQVVASIYHYSSFFPYSTVIDSTMNGSGILFKADETHYYILTNQHVIDDKDKLATYEVTLFDQDEPIAATLIAYDEDLDLAVLKVPKGIDDDIEIMDLTTRIFKKFNPGELVLAVGNPLSVVNNVTFGEFLSMESIANASFKVIYHNAMIHEGSSGGALTDIDGNFLGVNTWGSSTTDEQSFAVPNDIVYMFLYNRGILE